MCGNVFGCPDRMLMRSVAGAESYQAQAAMSSGGS